MKNLAKSIGIITLLVIIGLSMVACDNDNTPGGNNIPASLIGTYGYTPTGSLTITFRNDGTFTGIQSSGPVNGTYTVSESSITKSAVLWVKMDYHRFDYGSGRERRQLEEEVICE